MDPALHVVTQLLSGSSLMTQRMQEAWETRVGSPSRDDPLEEETATYSNIVAWRAP